MSFTSNVDKENSFPYFGRINAISECLSFQIHLAFYQVDNFSSL